MKEINHIEFKSLEALVDSNGDIAKVVIKSFKDGNMKKENVIVEIGGEYRLGNSQGEDIVIVREFILDDLRNPVAVLVEYKDKDRMDRVDISSLIVE